MTLHFNRKLVISMLVLTLSQGEPTNRAIRVVTYRPKKQNPVMGGKFIETPTPTSQPPQRNTPPTFSCYSGWAMGRGRGQTRVGEIKISTLY